MMIAMRNFGAALFALTTCLAVNAAYIVNTGSNPNGTGWTFASFQYSAGEFAVGSAQTINSVEGFYQTFIPTPGNVTISLHSDGGNIPGATLFSQSHSLPANSALDWFGAFGLGWNVASGVYWVSFEPDAKVFGIHPGDAPFPLDEYAGHRFGVWQDAGPNAFDYLDVGIRIDATPSVVPEPSTLALVGLALIGMRVKRKMLR